MTKSLTPCPSPKGEGSIYLMKTTSIHSVTTPLSTRRGAGGEAEGVAGCLDGNGKESLRLGKGGNITLGDAGHITLGDAGNITLGSVTHITERGIKSAYLGGFMNFDNIDKININ